MNSFTFSNPTKIYFGENAVFHLAEALKEYGKNVLLCYGGGSIKTTGVYDSVTAALRAGGKTVFELSGIMPNPRTEKVYEGIKLCKENAIDFILAVGGGSVIDCAKFIAAGARTDRDFWQAFLINHEECYDALPLGAVLTLAATGSEMNDGGVITNWEAKQKLAYGHPVLQPKFSILDPTYTYSLPRNQVIYGAVDILSHLWEQYFSYPNESNLSDDLAEGIMRNVIDNLNAALSDPQNYTARANLMWDSTMALNGLVGLSKEQDWQTHSIEHALSAFYDIPHGAGLAVVHPNWMRCVYRNATAKFARYAVNIWRVDPTGKTEEQVALEGIERTQAYFRKIGAPTTLAEVGIPAEALAEIAATIPAGGGSYRKLTAEDIRTILQLCL